MEQQNPNNAEARNFSVLDFRAPSFSFTIPVVTKNQQTSDNEQERNSQQVNLDMYPVCILITIVTE